MKAGPRNISANLRILPTVPAPGVELCERDILSVTILIAFSRSAGRDLPCGTWGTRKATSKEYITHVNHALSCRFSKMFIGISHKL